MIELYEKLAAIEHQRWNDWMRYQFSVCLQQEDGTMIIPAHLVSGWSRQVATDYNDLSEPEKDEDRKQVDRYWRFIQEKDKHIKVLERVQTQAQIIFDSVNIKNHQRSKMCPHGNSTDFPIHGWWCDECWFALGDALSQLEEV